MRILCAYSTSHMRASKRICADRTTSMIAYMRSPYDDHRYFLRSTYAGIDPPTMIVYTMISFYLTFFPLGRCVVAFCLPTFVASLMSKQKTRQEKIKY